MSNFEGITGAASISDSKPESAKKALGDIGRESIGDGILAHPELVDILNLVNNSGRTVSVGFYGDIEKVDPSLARSYLKEVAKNNPSALPEMRLDKVIAGGEIDAESTVVMHKLNLAKEKSGNIIPFERPKTEMELRMIHKAAENVNALRVQHGLTPVELTSEQVHMIEKGANGKTLGHSNGESVVVYDGLGDTARFATIQHELIHLGGYSAVNVPKGSGEVTVYRSGLQVQGQKRDENGDYPSFLVPLNEAVTEENARRITLAISEDDPELGELSRKRKHSLEEMEKIRRRGNALPDESFLQQELYCADIDWDRKTMDVQASSYTDERQAMWQLFDRIHEKNPNAFASKSRAEAREEMFGMVTKASLDGNIVPFGRLMNDTFGHGTFREYGHLQTAQEIITLLDSLDATSSRQGGQP